MTAELVVVGSRRDERVVDALRRALDGSGAHISFFAAEDPPGRRTADRLSHTDLLILLMSPELVQSALRTDLHAAAAAADRAELLVMRIVLRPASWDGDPQLAELTGHTEDWTALRDGELDTAVRELAPTVRQYLDIVAARPLNTAAVDPAPAPRIFISYAMKPEDALVVQIVQQKLGTRYQVWTGYEIGAGDPWKAAIDAGIRSCAAVLVVVSPAAMASHYVTYEWAFALGAAKPVIPILRTAVPREQRHPALEDLQYLDFSHTIVEKWPFERLIERLQKRIGR